MRKLFLLGAVLFTDVLPAQNADTTVADSLNPELSFQLDQRKWSVGFEYEGTVFYRHLRCDAEQELVGCRNMHEELNTGINVAFSLRYELNNSIELVTGISFFETGFKFSEPKNLSDTLDMEFMIGCEVHDIVDPERGFVGIGFYDPRYSYQVYGLHPKSVTMYVDLEYHYAEVPLLLKVNMGKKRTRGFISAGVGVNYLTSCKLMINLNNNRDYGDQYTTYELFSFYQRLNYSVLIALGVESKLIRNFSVGFHLGGRYQLRSLFTKDFNEEYKEHHYNISGGAQVTYHFPKSSH
jgi:hypothetical protein